MGKNTSNTTYLDTLGSLELPRPELSSRKADPSWCRRGASTLPWRAQNCSNPAGSFPSPACPDIAPRFGQLSASTFQLLYTGKKRIVKRSLPQWPCQPGSSGVGLSGANWRGGKFWSRSAVLSRIRQKARNKNSANFQERGVFPQFFFSALSLKFRTQCWLMSLLGNTRSNESPVSDDGHDQLSATGFQGFYNPIFSTWK